jgi:hypothetical protein
VRPAVQGRVGHVMDWDITVRVRDAPKRPGKRARKLFLKPRRNRREGTCNACDTFS